MPVCAEAPSVAPTCKDTPVDKRSSSRIPRGTQASTSLPALPLACPDIAQGPCSTEGKSSKRRAPAAASPLCPPANSLLLPFPTSVRCAARMLPASKWSRREGPGKKSPRRATLWGRSSSRLKQASQALCQPTHTETCQPPSSQRLRFLGSQLLSPRGFCRRARCFSWEDSLQHPSAGSPASWQGSSVEG